MEKPIEDALRDRAEQFEERLRLLQDRHALLVDLLRARNAELDRERRLRAVAECDRDAARDTLIFTQAAG